MAFLPTMAIEQAEKLVHSTDYALEAIQPEDNPINFADAAMFYLEGYEKADEAISELTPEQLCDLMFKHLSISDRYRFMDRFKELTA